MELGNKITFTVSKPGLPVTNYLYVEYRITNAVNSSVTTTLGEFVDYIAQSCPQFDIESRVFIIDCSSEQILKHFDDRGLEMIFGANSCIIGQNSCFQHVHYLAISADRELELSIHQDIEI
jgi:malate synthase